MVKSQDNFSLNRKYVVHSLFRQLDRLLYFQTIRWLKDQDLFVKQLSLTYTSVFLTKLVFQSIKFHLLQKYKPLSCIEKSLYLAKKARWDVVRITYSGLKFSKTNEEVEYMDSRKLTITFICKIFNVIYKSNIFYFWSLSLIFWQ